jgi:hypothetical protein
MRLRQFTGSPESPQAARFPRKGRGARLASPPSTVIIVGRGIGPTAALPTCRCPGGLWLRDFNFWEGGSARTYD